MAEQSPARALRTVLLLALALVLPGAPGASGARSAAAQAPAASGSPESEMAPPGSSPGAADDAPAGGQAAAAVVPTSPEATLLVLPSMRASGEGERNAWGPSADAARFAGLEEALGAALGESGYGVVTAREALEKRGFRDVLARITVPMTPAWAVEAAAAAGAQVALVISAEVIRTRGSSPASAEMADALLHADAYRAPDGARLASATTRVTGEGKSAAEADAQALGRAAAPLAQALEGPLRAGVARPVVEPRPMEIVLEGRLDWRGYTQAVGLIRDALPEIGSLQERRFAPGRFTLRAVCGCEVGEAARRLDGLERGGLRLTATEEGAILRVRVARSGAPPLGMPDPAFTDAPP